jgi:hypothetical protein
LSLDVLPFANIERVPPISHAKELIRPFTTIARAVQEGLAFRSKASIGVVVSAAREARVTQPPLRP